MLFCDDDSQEDKVGSRRLDLLAALGVPEGTQSEYMVTQHWVVGALCCIFGGNFERTMRAAFGSEYEALEEEALARYALGQDSKPLVARHVAERVAQEGFPEAWAKFERLSEVVTGFARGPV